MIKVCSGISFRSLAPEVKNTVGRLFPTSGGRFAWPAGIGAVGGAAASGLVEPERGDPDPMLTRLRNAGIGAGLGLAGGLGVGALRRYGAGPVAYAYGVDGQLKQIAQPTTSILDKLLGRKLELRGLPLHPAEFDTATLRKYLEQETGYVSTADAFHGL